MGTMARRNGFRGAAALLGGLVAGLIALVGVLYALSLWTTVLPAYLRQPGPAPAPVSDRDERWRQDVRYLAAQLPRLHPEPFARTSQVQFEQAVSDLDAAIPQLSDQEIVAALMRLTAMLGDAHTRAIPPQGVTFHFYPMQLYWFQDGIFVTGASAQYTHLIGARLVKIGSMSIEQAVTALTPYISHDNRSGVRLMIQYYLLCPELLSIAAGISPGDEGLAYTFVDRAGQTVVERLQPVLDREYDALFSGSYPGWRLAYRPERRQEEYWFEYLPQAHLLYIQYNACRERSDVPMTAFAGQVAAVLQQQPVERLVVDLRQNSGGSSEIIDPLLEVIRTSALNRKGGLFVLLGRETFSAAMLNTVDFARQTQATFIGETPSGAPNHYGEVHTLFLPNSRMRVRYSCKHFVADGFSAVEFIPEVLIEPVYADFAARRDPVMDYLLGRPAW